MYRYELAPNNWADIWKRYVENGMLPGSFGEALLCNDLRGSISAADHINRTIIPLHVEWLWNEAPSICWGSPEKVRAWVERGGMLGRAA